MFIGICGGTCAGKRSIAEYLINGHGFRAVALDLRISKGMNHNPSRLLGDSFGERVFTTLDELLNFVTARWRERWLITNVSSEDIVSSLLQRPFFLLISVDAPVMIRWQRYLARCIDQKAEPISLDQFVSESDGHYFGTSAGLAHLMNLAQLRLLNSSISLDDLHKSLFALNLTNEERLRPSWDEYFMRLASLAAQRSNCMKRRVGCVVVREKRVISTGYNGTPRHLRNCNDGGCPRCNGALSRGADLATCLCLHAEENALLEAGRERIRDDTTLYCDTCPCLTCSVKITQVGISEVVYSQSYSMDDVTAAIFREAGVKLRQFTPPRNGLVDLGAHDLLEEIGASSPY